MNVHNKIVADQYDIIYKSFDNSRVRIWNSVKEFIIDKNESETLLDGGCGNGKNMVFAESHGYICEGFDISNHLLSICKNKNLNVYYSDVLNINLNKRYDKIIAIAVLHHLQGEDDQLIAIKNLYKLLNDGGKLLISFWSKEKNFYNLLNNKADIREFDVGPNYVDWKYSRELTIKRYYYIHNYDSITKLANLMNVDYDIKWELQNWFITFYKK